MRGSDEWKTDEELRDALEEYNAQGVPRLQMLHYLENILVNINGVKELCNEDCAILT